MHDATKSISISQVLESDPSLFRETRTHAPGPVGVLPITAEMLLTQPSGNLFGLSQNAGMGWEPACLLDSEFLILSTHGGMRAEDGTPIALGFHTGHWEVGLLVADAARELRRKNAIPFAGACTDPCDGRTQGTAGMLDSLAYRNDAAIVLRRLMRSLPTRRGVIGVATCDKGLPAMMMALASSGALPSILVPGGVTLLPENGEDAGQVQSIGTRFAQNQITLRVCRRGGLSSLCHTGWRMSVSGHCRDVAGCCRGHGVVTPSRCTRAFGTIDLAGRGHPVGSRYVADGSVVMGAVDVLVGCSDSQCHGVARGVRRIDELAVTRARHRARRWIAPAGGSRLGINQSCGSTSGGRASEWAEQLRDRSSISCGRSAGGDAASTAVGTAGLQCADSYGRNSRRESQLVGAERAAQRVEREVAHVGWHLRRRCDSFPRPGARPRTHADGLFSYW